MTSQWLPQIQHSHTVMFMVLGGFAAYGAMTQDAIAARPTGKEAWHEPKVRATEPADVTRLITERLNAGDAAGVAALYEPQAVLAYPVGQATTGHDAIQAIYQHMADAGVRFAIEPALPTVRFENLALTSTRSADHTGVRVQVLRRQPDGSWLRIIDRPEVPQP